MRWLKDGGMTELSLSGSVGYMITHASVDYHGEGFFGDQLRVLLSATPPSRREFQLYYKVTNESSGKVIAEAETRQVFFDFAARKIASASAPFLALFASEEDAHLPPAL